jgi:hypothetical protein
MSDGTNVPAVPRTSSGVIPPPRFTHGVALVTECRCCGHEADDAPGPPPPRCPKCGGSAWARFARLDRDHSQDAAGAARRTRVKYGGRRQPTFDRPAHHVSSAGRASGG